MAYSRDANTFRITFVQDNTNYTLIFLPYSFTDVGGTIVDLPNNALIKNSIKFDTDYNNNIRVGLKSAGEMSFILQGDNFTGDFEEVFNWVVKRGVTTAGQIAAISDKCENVTNRWILKKETYSGSDIYITMFSGYQLATGDGATIEINKNRSRFDFEVKCVDSSVAILSDIKEQYILDTLDTYKSTPNYCAGLYAFDMISGGGNPVVDRMQIGLESKNENEGYYPLPDFRDNYQFITIEDFLNTMKTCVNAVAVIKNRAYSSATLDMFNDIEEIISNYEFYEYLSTYNVANKGIALALSDIVLLLYLREYDSSTSTYTIKQNLLNDFLGTTNIKDLFNSFCEVLTKFMKRKHVGYNYEKLHFVDIDDLTTDAITLTTSSIINNFQLKVMENLSVNQVFNFKTISDLDKIAEEIRTDATTLNQASYEIDAIVDNFIPQIKLDGINENARLIGVDTYIYGSTAKSNTNKYNSLMYIKDYPNPDDTTQIACQVHNVVKRGAVTFGTTLTNPSVYGQNINGSDAVKLVEYITAAQDQSGLALAFTETLNTLFSPNPKNATLICTLDFSIFSGIESDYGFDVCGIPIIFDINDFTTVDIDIYSKGYISKIVAIDLNYNTIEVEILLISD